MRRWAATALLGVALVAGCTATVESPRPPATETPAGEQATDVGLRPVQVPYRDALGDVWPETAAQAICQALNSAEWADILGGATRREVSEDPAGVACVVSAGGVELTLFTTATPLAGTPVTIAGHDAQVVVRDKRTSAEATVALGPATQQRPLLSAVVVAKDTASANDLLVKMLGDVVPRLSLAGPPAPAPDVTGRLTYPPAETIPPARLSDLPAPAQALSLCAAMVEHTAPAPSLAVVEATVEDGATCRWSTPELVSATVVSGATSTQPTTEIAGHPANLTDGKATIVILDGQALLNLYRPTAAPEALRAWVTEVLSALGEL